MPILALFSSALKKLGREELFAFTQEVLNQLKLVQNEPEKDIRECLKFGDVDFASIHGGGSCSQRLKASAQIRGKNVKVDANLFKIIHDIINW